MMWEKAQGLSSLSLKKGWKSIAKTTSTAEVSAVLFHFD